MTQARRLDYRAPAEGVRTEALEAATRKLMEACLAGERSACWRAHATSFAGVTSAPIGHQAAVRAAENCLAGDRPSCVALETAFGNALITRKPTVADAELDACALGDQVACTQSFNATECLLQPRPSESCDALRGTADPEKSIALATDLCRRGLGAACRLLVANASEIHLSDAQAADYERQACRRHDGIGCELAAGRAGWATDRDDEAYLKTQRDQARRAGCADGDAYACQRLDDPSAEAVAGRACQAGLIDVCPLANAARALEQMCSTSGDNCDELAKLRGPAGDAARDALEHGCQFFRFDQCMQLVDGYESHEWHEPTPTRASDLTRLMCSQPASDQPEWHERHCAKPADE